MGNALYRTALLMMYECFASGAVGILEHPAPPSDPGAPSSWFLPEVAHLRSLGRPEAIDQVWIDQCMCGAVSVKPTVLLAVPNCVPL